ncbi:MAG: Holliday junction resolvase RuvX [Anaerolineaceae bacterium]
MRILAVDPGEKNIGLAVSDPTGTIANPLQVIKHVARAQDAAAIVRIAESVGAEEIVVGIALDENGEIGFAARKSVRMAEALRAVTSLPVQLWDESNSTETAQAARRAMGVKHARRQGHMDELAATVILQSYLDSRNDQVEINDNALES